MKKMTRQQLPLGWSEKNVRELAAHYDNQSEDEGAAEIETAPEAGETWISVPTELVPAIARLIEGYEQNNKVRQRTSKTRSKNARTQRTIN